MTGGLENPESLAPLPQQDKQKIPAGKPQLADTFSTAASSLPAAPIDWDKKIIKTASLTLEIGNFKKYNESVHGIVQKFGGYIAQEEQHLTGEKSETVLSIKVPVDQFESMLNELPPAEAKILQRTITSQDVTGDIVDTRSRLESKKQVRLKYLDFLKASKNIDEVLKVQKEIDDMQEAIEAATGRVTYLTHQSAFSTVNLTFYQPTPGFKPVENNPGFLHRVSEAFRLGTDWVASLFVAMVSVWPLLLLATIGFVVVKRMKFLKSNLQNP